MYYMQREIRMAGSNPKKTLPLSDFGIQTAGKNTITFTEDVRGPDNSDPSIQDAPDGDVGDPDENITYDLNGTDLRRTDNVTDPTNHPVVAQNIDALDFVYLDESSAPIPFDATDKVAAADLDKIRSVQITIVARTNHSLLYGTKNNNTYVNQQNQAIYTSPVPGGDNISRRLLTTSIHCRNLSL